MAPDKDITMDAIGEQEGHRGEEGGVLVSAMGGTG